MRQGFQFVQCAQVSSAHTHQGACASVQELWPILLHAECPQGARTYTWVKNVPVPFDGELMVSHLLLEMMVPKYCPVRSNTSLFSLQIPVWSPTSVSIAIIDSARGAISSITALHGTAMSRRTCASIVARASRASTRWWYIAASTLVSVTMRASTARRRFVPARTCWAT